MEAFILNTLGRKFSRSGLLITALLAGVARAGVYLVLAWMLSYPFIYIEIAVLEPGLAASAGPFMLRTENVLSCAAPYTGNFAPNFGFLKARNGFG